MLFAKPEEKRKLSFCTKVAASVGVTAACFLLGLLEESPKLIPVAAGFLLGLCFFCVDAPVEQEPEEGTEEYNKKYSPGVP